MKPDIRAAFFAVHVQTSDVLLISGARRAEYYKPRKQTEHAGRSNTNPGNKLVRAFRNQKKEQTS